MPVSHNLLNSGYELTIVPHGALAEALENNFLRGGEYSNNFNMLSTVVSR